MSQTLRILGLMIVWAWRGSISKANAWLSLTGGIALWIVLRLFRISFAFSSSIAGILAGSLVSLIAGSFLVFILRIIYSPIAIIKELQNVVHDQTDLTDRLKGELAGGTVHQNTLRKAIEIEFGLGPRFFKPRYMKATNNTRQEVWIYIRNVGNGFLTECIVNHLDAYRPGRTFPMTYDISNTWNLSRGQNIPVLVATLHEKGSDARSVSSTEIGICFWQGARHGKGWEWLSDATEQSPAQITLEASSADCDTETKKFNLWVSTNYELRMAESK